MEERNGRFTQSAEKALEESYYTAKRLGHGCVGSEHLVIGMLRAGENFTSIALSHHDVDVLRLEEEVIRRIGRGDPGMQPQGMTPRCKRIIELAGVEAGGLGKRRIGCEHLLLGILRQGDNTALGMLRESGITPNLLAEEVYAMMGLGSGQGSESVAGKKARTRRAPEPIKGELEKCGRDLTAEALLGRLDPVIGREKEINRVVRILCRRSKNNPCLVGEPGVGKTAVAEGLAQAICDGDVPGCMQDKVVFSLDLSAVIAGTKYRGEFEERMRSIIQETIKMGNVILFIDEIHNLIDAGGADGAIDAANILKPMLARGEFQVIGATTNDEYRKRMEKDAALDRRFSKVEVAEPTQEETFSILRGLLPHYEEHHGVKITEQALRAAIELSTRYIHDRFLPDKAIDLIDEAASNARMRQSEAAEEERYKWEDRLAETAKTRKEAIEKKDYEAAALLREEELFAAREKDAARERSRQAGAVMLPQVDAEAVREIVSERTGIPVTRIGQSETERLLHLEEQLGCRVEGQQAAIKAVAAAVRRNRVGLGDPDRPIGSFLFVGPTGVGKTALCKSLAEVLFGNEQALIRIDMSEFAEKHTVSRLIGSPPGYTGHEEGGQLTEKVRRRPYAVVLFDEIEKAHPEVFDLFLQLLDDGRLTDGQGRTVDFKNTVIVMTSNIGTGAVIGEKNRLGFGESDAKDERAGYMTALKHSFRPEFLGRIDAVVPFERLTEQTLSHIAEGLLLKTAERVKERGITLSWEESIPHRLAEKALVLGGGARPLGRLVKTEIEDALSDAILWQSLGDGDYCQVSFREGKICLTGERINIPL